MSNILPDSMYVIKRNGEQEEVSFDKVKNRIKFLAFRKKPLLNKVNCLELAQKVCSRIYDNVKTSQLDELASELAATSITIDPQYGQLASRLVISNHQKNTSPSFSETIYILYNNKVLGESSPLISKEIYDIVMSNKSKLNDVINYDRDFNFDYFGFKTLERAYLLKSNGKVIERPQHMIMRVALGIHGNDFKDALQTYEYMSNKDFIHATPTLFNSGTPRPQLSSCFLLAMKSDSIDGIFETMKECALISKWAGGIGLHIHNVRAKGSTIRGTNGISNGLVPMLRVFNNTARYVDQGGGKRNGSFAIYLSPWHSDIESFLRLKKNHGNEEERARDLFFGLWVSDLFMRRVKEDQQWTLMCPDKCPGLADCYGKEFDELYLKYEKEGKGNKVIKAQELWFQILDSQIETGTPYLLYKDSCNKKSNQKNLGVIKSSNLCTEIIEYSDENETAVCNLASINLNAMLIDKKIPENAKFTLYTKSNCNYCIWSKKLLKNKNIEFNEINMDDEGVRKKWLDEINKDKEEQVKTFPQIFYCEKDAVTEHIGGFEQLYTYLTPSFNFEKLEKISGILTKNLNKVIDRGFYPTPGTKLSNKRHRPIGIGVQGLADVFARMKIPFDSKDAKDLNNKIFETIYYGAINESINISKKREKSMIKIKKLKLSNSENLVKEIEELESIYKPIDEELNREKYLGSYSSFNTSPAANGILQFDMWGISPGKRYNWGEVKDRIKKYGLRNSLLIAPMPTASTSQILGNNECFEPFTSNIYVRRTLAGEFIIINKYLLNDLIMLDLWNPELKDEIIINNGKISNIKKIPGIFKTVYKTVWEISQKAIIDMAVDRGAWVCQSQSMNLFLPEPDYQTLSSMHFYGWEKGLKTGIYYLRTQPKTKAIQFTIDPSTKKKVYNITQNENEICESCSA
jgi:ribonucleoside-diphosphate reductase alpha subunit